MLILETIAGDRIKQVTRDMCAIAREEKQLVFASFNGIELVARPGDNAKSVERYYRSKPIGEDLSSVLKLVMVSKTFAETILNR